MAGCDWPRSTFSSHYFPGRNTRSITKKPTFLKTKWQKLNVMKLQFVLLLLTKDKCKWLLVEKKEYINLKLLRMLLIETKF